MGVLFDVSNNIKYIIAYQNVLYMKSMDSVQSRVFGVAYFELNQYRLHLHNIRKMTLISQDGAVKPEVDD